MTEHDDQQTDVEHDDAPRGRRSLLTKASAAAAVAAVAGVAVSQSAEAADGDDMRIGRTNTGNSVSTTFLTGGTSFRVDNGVTSGGAQSSIRGISSADDHAGVRGEASGSAGWGVYGIATGDSGRGVYGTNSGSAGAGVHGLNTSSDTVAHGVLGRNTGRGPGVQGTTTDASDAGVYGTHNRDGGPGVYGHHTSSTQSGPGVVGRSELGQGVVGRGATLDLVADRSGRMRLSQAGQAGNPAAAGEVGTIARDAEGNLWYCVATNQWRQLNAPTFTPIAPIRAYDSRIGAIPQSGNFAPGGFKVISIKDGRDQATGSVTAADAVPAGATAVAYNVTVAGTTGGSFLSVAPGDVAAVATSALNWTGAGAVVANAGIVGVDASRQIRIIAGPGGSFDAIVDITGYWA